MSNNGNATTSPVSNNEGRIEQVPDLNVPASRIYGFVQLHKDYFEDHSLDWSLDEILTRGMAEITRQVKTQVKAAENRAAGSLLKEFNMTPVQAKQLLIELARQKAQADAKAAKA
jgi:hypothetical protein